MRSQRAIYARGEPVRREYVTPQDVPDALETLLATQGLVNVTERFADRIVMYTAWEYDCMACGSYDHAEENCPEVIEDETVQGDPVQEG